MIKYITSLFILFLFLNGVSQNCGDIEYASAFAPSIDASDTSLVINQGLVTNLGTCEITQSTMKIYLSESNNTAQLTNGFLAGEVIIPSLMPNETYDLTNTTIDLRYCQATPGSNYYIGFILDANGVIPETNSNNTLITGNADFIFPGAINTSSSLRIFEEIKVSSYPVPFNKQVNVKLENLNNQKTILIIRDITGKVVSTTFTKQATTKVNTEELVEGVYFLSIIQNNTTIEVKKIIKSNSPY